MISERVSKIKYAIRDLEVGVKPGTIKINIGDPLAYDLKMPKIMENKICEAVRKGYNFYADSQGLLELREQISKRQGITKEDVIITAGTSEAVNFLFATILKENDEILLPSPSYPQYPAMVKLFGGKPVFYKCNPEDEWVPRIEDIKKKMGKRTRAIVIINPNNPTGAVYPKDFIKELCEFCAEKKLLIISDEIYSELIFEGKHRPITEFAKSPAVLLNGISKGYLAPGLRIGWMTFHNFKNTELREGILKLCRLRLCANTPAQYAIAEVMKEEGSDGKEYLERILRKLKERRDFTMDKLDEFEINCVLPKGTFYTFPWIENRKWKDDLDFVLKLRDRKKVLVVHGGGFDYGRPNEIFFRIVFLPPKRILGEALNRIGEFIR